MATQHQHDKFLRETYRLAMRGGGALERVNRDDLLRYLGFSDAEYEACAAYWHAQGFAEPDAAGHVRLTSEGATRCGARFGQLL